MTDRHPRIIQGGMGIAVSGWQLARAVSREGELGVISGTAIDSVMVRRLQDGDQGGHMRRALAAFPVPGVADLVLQRFFAKPRAAGTPYRMLPMHRKTATRTRQQITMLANFAEVWLAKEGHDGVVGINLLTKVQMPNLPSLYGAMLAGVDYVLMGAGIPREIPGALDSLARHETARLHLDVDGAQAGADDDLTFDPGEHAPAGPPLKRPAFLAIVSAHSLAASLAKKASGRVDGFIIEGPTAGGHNAPPRGTPRFLESGEPLYGERDVVDLARIRELGLPFWIAGGVGTPDGLRAARDAGAEGIQVGTLFAYCTESGLDPDLRKEVLDALSRDDVRLTVRTDAHASPTGYPFKVVIAEDAPSQDDGRERVCDLGYLRTAYRTPDQKLVYRCPSEPVDQYVAKGGNVADTAGRRCLCNALMANIGLPQVRETGVELPLITSGDDLVSAQSFARGRHGYSAADVLRYLRGYAAPVAG